MDRMITYRVYKNEFSPNYIAYLKSNLCAYWVEIVEETANVLTIATWESNVGQIQEMMYQPFKL
jgi:hypothetical protein